MPNNIPATPTNRFIMDLVDDFNLNIIGFQPQLLEKAFASEGYINNINPTKLIGNLTKNDTADTISIINVTTPFYDTVKRQLELLEAIQKSKYTLSEEGTGLRVTLKSTIEELKELSANLLEEIRFFTEINDSVSSGLSTENKAGIKLHLDSLKKQVSPSKLNLDFKKTALKHLEYLSEYFKESTTKKKALSIDFLEERRMPDQERTVYILETTYKKFGPDDDQVKGHKHTINKQCSISVDKIADKYHGFIWKHKEEDESISRFYAFPILSETNSEELRVHVIKAAIEILLFFCSLHRIILTNQENIADSLRVDIAAGNVQFLNGEVAIEQTNIYENQDSDGKVHFHDPSFRVIIEEFIKPEFIESQDENDSQIIIHMYNDAPCCYFKETNRTENE
jgi:hypothetical protein